MVCDVPGSQLVAKILLRPAEPEEVEERLAALVRRGRWADVTASLLAGEPRRAGHPRATGHDL